MDSHLLRAEALVLLQSAAAIDGLKPFLLSHRHATGTTAYIMWSREQPDEARASELVDQFDPACEELSIEAAVDLREIVGVAPACIAA